MSSTLTAIKTSADKAFPDSALSKRLNGFADTAAGLSARRNILTHGAVMPSSDGGLRVYHTRTRPPERTIYTITIADVIALDDQITRANLDLEAFSVGRVDDRIPASRDNPELSGQLRMAQARVPPVSRPDLLKKQFPSA